ncbi:S41 family peptidase [Acidobacteria bacterium AB60]|nr:S41 family peptidase [Acidobacteria bacterium AB60]
MLRRLLPLVLLSTAIASAQLPGPPPGVSFPRPNLNAPPPPDTAPAAPLPEPVPVATPNLSSAERRQVIETVAARLRSSYILPEMAQQLADSLQSHQQQGDYDSITDGALLAARLTSDLQAVSRDRHLRIEYSASRLPAEEGGPSAEEEQQYRQELVRSNCGFQRVEILPGNIGYVQFNFFGAPDVCGPTAATAIKFVAHADALIFDVRQNRGGDPAMVALLLSYLFDRPVHLDDLYNRRENKTTQYWATPEKVADRLPTQPIYVLTSRLTFSGAEQFSYDLHNLHRAVLIGERTGGAAHPTRNHRINDHFFVATPEYRYINTVTRSDWEGQGVTPDVPAAPWNALVAAQKIALTRLDRTSVHPLPATAMR